MAGRAFSWIAAALLLLPGTAQAQKPTLAVSAAQLTDKARPFFADPANLEFVILREFHPGTGVGGGMLLHFERCPDRPDNGRYFAAVRGCWARQDASRPTLEMFGLAAGNAAAANTQALRNALASGVTGRIEVHAGTFRINGPVIVPGGVYLSGAGMGGPISASAVNGGTVFVNENCAATTAFLFRHGSEAKPDQSQWVAPADFSVTSACRTGATIGISAEQFGNGSSIRNVKVFGMRGDGFYFNNPFDLTATNLVALQNGGRGVVSIGAAQSTWINIQSRFNQGDGIYFRSPLGVTMIGGDTSTSVSGAEIHITGGQGMTLVNPYCENLTSSPSQHCLLVDGDHYGLNASLTWGDGPEPFGRTIINIESAQHARIQGVSVPGTSLGSRDVIVRLGKGCGHCIAEVTGDGRSMSENSTSRLIYPPGRTPSAGSR